MLSAYYLRTLVVCLKMRKDITFMSKEVRCSGWLYVPDDLKTGVKAPTIVMANGFTGVKEQILPDFAAKFVDAGFVTMVFDYRYFGDSEGEPRSQNFPLEMVEDYRNAITWVSERPEWTPNESASGGPPSAEVWYFMSAPTTDASKRWSPDLSRS
jgi:fermentation-respiration switch protein FrsA (DUF1100 family)